MYAKPDIFDYETDIFAGFSKHHLKIRPLDNRIRVDHSNTRLVWYSDGYCNVQDTKAIFPERLVKFNVTIYVNHKDKG